MIKEALMIYLPSFPLRRESSFRMVAALWIPACAGMTYGHEH